MSVQEHAINQHFTDDKQITVPTTEGEIVLGTQSILAKQVRLLAELWRSESLFGSIYKQRAMWN